MESLTNFYWLLLPQVMAQAVWYAPWRKLKKKGILAMLWELIKALTLTNIHAFYMIKNNDWTPGEAQRLLRDQGVPAFGFVYSPDGCIFHVPVRQARWAERVLMQSGVPLQ